MSVYRLANRYPGVGWCGIECAYVWLDDQVTRFVWVLCEVRLAQGLQKRVACAPKFVGTIELRICARIFIK